MTLLRARYSPNSENAVIGSILIEGTKFYEEINRIIYPKDFYDQKCRAAFKIFAELYVQKIPVDYISTTEYVVRNKIKVPEDLILFLTIAMNSVPTTKNFHYYVREVSDYAYRREILKIVEDFKADKIKEEELTQRIVSIPKYEEIKSKTSKEIILETIADAKRGMDFEFPESFMGINKLIGGIDRGDLVVIGGYPSNGKSSLLSNLVIGFVNEGGYRVLVTTLEMSPKQNMRRILAHTCWINTMKFRTKSLTEDDKKSIKAMIDLISLWKYNCVQVYNIPDVVRAVNKYQPDILFVDYLQNITGDDNLNLYHKTTKHALQIQQLAREKNVATFLLSQFHRPEGGTVRRPRNTDFRDSGAIEEKADVIFLIYWKRKLKMENLVRNSGDAPEFMELNITKSKDGATGGLNFHFYPEYHRWVDPEDDKKEPIKYKKAKEVSERKDIDG